MDQTDSMIRFRCSQCGKKLKAERELVGRRVKCTDCEAIETVPQQTGGSQPSGEVADPSSVSVSEAESQETKRLLVKELKSKSNLPGRSASASSAEQVVGREFKLKEKSSGPGLRWALAIGALLCLIVASAVTYTVIKRAYVIPKFAAEFESMEEVAFYRRAHGQLAKVQKRMSIMANAFKAKGSRAGDFSEQYQQFNSSIENYTSNSEPLLRQAADLLAQGKAPHAKGLLVNTGVEMRDLVLEIEREIGKFNKKTRR